MAALLCMMIIKSKKIYGRKYKLQPLLGGI